MSGKQLKIGVLGANATGLSAAVALAQRHTVVLQDPASSIVHQINARICPIEDQAIRHHLEFKNLDLRATIYRHDALQQADLIIVATPTNFIEWSQVVDTTELDTAVLQAQQVNPEAMTIIESTCPVGYTRDRSHRYGFGNLISAPALLRHGNALTDRLHPLRYVIGENSERARMYARTLQECTSLPQVPTLFTGSAEAEAIQLFNLRKIVTGREPQHEEIIQYSERHHLNKSQLIHGLDLSVDPIKFDN